MFLVTCLLVSSFSYSSESSNDSHRNLPELPSLRLEENQRPSGLNFMMRRSCNARSGLPSFFASNSILPPVLTPLCGYTIVNESLAGVSVEHPTSSTDATQETRSHDKFDRVREVLKDSLNDDLVLVSPNKARLYEALNSLYHSLEESIEEFDLSAEKILLGSLILALEQNSYEDALHLSDYLSEMLQMRHLDTNEIQEPNIANEQGAF